MEIPTPLRNLAQLLQVRKQQSKPYNLLLTSAISLTPEVLTEICGSADWQKFRAYLRGLGPNDRLEMLNYHLRSDNQESYRALVRLIKAGYFSTVLTTNLDSALEAAILEYQLQPPNYQTLVVGRDQDEYIAAALENQASTIRIVKLHGSLSDRVLPATFPDFFELPDPIRDGLERYLNRDIIIVGTLNREDDIARSLTIRGRSSIYYVLPQDHSVDDEVIQAIVARGNNPSTFVISGQYGHFETFFLTLDTLLQVDSPIVSVDAPPTKKQAIKPAELDSSKAVTAPKSLQDLTSVSREIEQQQQFVYPLSKIEREQKPASTQKQEEGKESPPVNIMIIKIVSGVIAIAALLGAVSLFVNLTPSFNAIFIIPLVIILAVFILGLMGILNANQITEIFSKGLNTKGDKSKKNDKQKVDS